MQSDSDRLEKSRLRRTLGRRIRELRTSSGLSASELARRSGVERTHISRIENGHQTPTIGTVERLTTALRLEPSLAADLSTIVHELNSASAHLTVDHHEIDWRQESTLSVEQNARLLDIHSIYSIPALLQTMEYSSACFTLFRSLDAHSQRIDREAQLYVRARRQAELFNNSKRFVFVIHEVALQYVVLPLADMAQQLRTLIERSKLPSVELHIVPTSEMSSFSVASYTMADRMYVVNDTPVGGIYTREPRLIARYRRHFDTMLGLSLDPDESRARCLEMAIAYENEATDTATSRVIDISKAESAHPPH